MEPLTLWVDHHFISPYALTAFVSLEEKRLPYTLSTVSLPKAEQQAPAYGARTGRVPSLQHGDYWLAESTAIAEYLAETFPHPGHPRLYPADLRERGICREVMSWLRSDLDAIREERGTHTVFYDEPIEPLSPRATRAVVRLLKLCEAVIPEGRDTLFAEWCIADVDLTMMLQRLRHSGDALPARFVSYADANWGRPSVEKWRSLPRPTYTPY